MEDNRWFVEVFWSIKELLPDDIFVCSMYREEIKIEKKKKKQVD